MTDLEMTAACAEAMDMKVRFIPSAQGTPWYYQTQQPYECYDPLHDDAQAMALVKTLQIDVVRRRQTNGDDDVWHTWKSESANLNRAIVECVAKMQKAKAK